MIPSEVPTPAPDVAPPLPRSFHLVVDFLSAAECDAVEALFAGDVLREGRIGAGEVNPEVRRGQRRRVRLRPGQPRGPHDSPGVSRLLEAVGSSAIRSW